MLQNATSLRKSVPGPPYISDEHVSCTAPATENVSFADPLQMSHTCQLFFEMLQDPHVLLIFEKVHNPLRLPHKTTSERPKVFRTPQFLALLTSKCASRRNGVHFFDISTSKSALKPSVFYTFDFEMCFANCVHFFDLVRHRNF